MLIVPVPGQRVSLHDLSFRPRWAGFKVEDATNGFWTEIDDSAVLAVCAFTDTHVMLLVEHLPDSPVLAVHREAFNDHTFVIHGPYLAANQPVAGVHYPGVEIHLLISKGKLGAGDRPLLLARFRGPDMDEDPGVWELPHFTLGYGMHLSEGIESHARDHHGVVVEDRHGLTQLRVVVPEIVGTGAPMPTDHWLHMPWHIRDFRGRATTKRPDVCPEFAWLTDWQLLDNTRRRVTFATREVLKDSYADFLRHPWQ